MSESPNLVAPPKRRGPLIGIVLAAIVLIAVAAVAIAAAVSGNRAPASAGGSGTNEKSGAITSGKGSPSDPIKIGVVGASDPYWDVYKKAAAAKGISIDLVDFTDYAQPNPALSQGDLDLNQFQHIIYLAQYNKSAGKNLVPIGSTAIYPLSLYSTKYKSVKDIPAGATVAVPNDASNLARGLLVLQSAGLVKLKQGGSPFSKIDDVLPGSRVKVTTLEAALTPTSLPDVAAAIINNDFVKDAGLTFKDAIASDNPSDASAQPYINIFAARAEDKDNKVYQRLVEIFQTTKAVTDGLKKVSGNTAVVVKTPVKELEKSLATVQAQIAK
jgi:D-methionine transport system substrate-binding protein